MRRGKSPGPDGIVLEFYKVFGNILGTEYTTMINESIREGRLPPGIIQGMIVLLHKGGDRQALTNWRPITLLNLGYKIYAKALQLRLQPVLMDVISPDQSAFLPLRFILDNLLITQETLAWAEYSNQPLIFLKLDFSKAYDMVEWQCMYKVMEKLGFPQAFIKMVSLLFHDALACVKLNGDPSPYFPIQRGVCQGCPLALYLFLIVAEVLNAMVSQEMREGRVQGISLPFEGRQQIIAQYADDTSFTLFGDEEKVRCLVYLLETFCMATGLMLNWTKSNGYWKHKGYVVQPPWTNMLRITWANEEEVSKLVEAPFGLSLATKDVDSFLFDKLTKKLVHWSTTKINSTSRSVVANNVLLSSTFFFLSIWGGSRKGAKRIKSAIMNYVARGKMQRARI